MKITVKSAAIVLLLLGSLFLAVSCTANTAGLWLLNIVEDTGATYTATLQIQQDGRQLSGSYTSIMSSGVLRGTISGKDFELIAIDDEVDIMRVTGSVDGNRMSGAYYNIYEGIYGIFTGTKM